MKKLLLILLCFICPLKVNAVQEETLILLDASVSMMESLEDTPKYLLAVNETKKILSNFDKNKAIGLRTIGVSIENAMDILSGDTEVFCKSTKLLIPIETNNITKINTKLDLIFPLGTTPITYSLQQAIQNDFSNSAYKHIILITDGGESCNADPCSYIKEIMSSRSDIKIDIIAIGVSGNDLNELNCLSDATSGELYNVKSPDDLPTALSKFLNNSTPIRTYKNQNIQNKIKQTIPKLIENEPKIKYTNYLLVE